MADYHRNYPFVYLFGWNLFNDALQMRAIIKFNDTPPLYLHGDSLGAYESGSYTNIKDYDKKENKILASIPTRNILFIEFEDAPKVTITIKEVSK